MKQISIKGILEDLSNGFTRYSDSIGNDPAIGSIEQKYELTKADVKAMFEHPLLMNKKTKKAPSFRLIDDVTNLSAGVNLQHIVLDPPVVEAVAPTVVEALPVVEEALEELVTEMSSGITEEQF